MKLNDITNYKKKMKLQLELCRKWNYKKHCYWHERKRGKPDNLPQIDFTSERTSPPESVIINVIMSNMFASVQAIQKWLRMKLLMSQWSTNLRHPGIHHVVSVNHVYGVDTRALKCTRHYVVLLHVRFQARYHSLYLRTPHKKFCMQTCKSHCWLFSTTRNLPM